MSFAPPQFVSVARLASAFTLGGDKARNPWSAGDVLACHGTFEDGSETDVGVFVVVRREDKGLHVLAPIGCSDEYWKEHLRTKHQVMAKILQEPGEKVKGDVELMRRWRILASAGSKLEKDSVAFLGRADADQAMKTWKFLVDTVVSDVERPKESDRDPHLFK